MISLTAIVISICSITSVSALEGQNICYGYKKQAVSVKISENDYQRIFQSVPVEYCCEGYTEKDNQCVPFCDRCSMGTCVEPGRCECHDNYGGPNCDLQLCKQGFWGENCNRPCPCQNNAQCDRLNGSCRCPAGFIGEECEKPCPEATFGRNCAQKCICANGFCSNVDGTCSCSKGWKGMDCSESVCSPGSFGENCQEKCGCIDDNTELCHPLTGICFCKPGWNNTDCSSPCPFPTYSIDCSKICECVGDNYSGCNPQTGECICKTGWKGDKCDVQCLSGNCKCANGFQGLHCDTPCEEGYYGEDCKEICFASGLNQLCNPETGVTYCADGYVGFSCENKCSINKYGKDCKRNCTCENGAKCHHETGECNCLAGWMGENCETKCPTGFYGVECKHKCNCANCRPSDGFCRCQQGWDGSKCKIYCPETLFDFEQNECIDPYSVTITISHANTYNIYIYPPIGILMLIGICFLVYKCYKSKTRYSEVPTTSKQGEDPFI